jgi:FkbM family methyltransferase
MKTKIRLLLQKYIVLRPILWVLFIFDGERILISRRKELEEIKNRVISETEQNLLNWTKDNGDSVLRFEYTLAENAVVFDVGGFEGNWSAEIFARYNADIYIFEPQLEFFEQIVRRFKVNSKIKVFPFGIGGKSENVLFQSQGDRSSVLVKPDNQTGNYAQIVDIVEFIKENAITKVDLIKINIESGEYELLERLIKEKYLSIFKNIQVQFHDFHENSEERMILIQKELEKTHTLTYQYKFIWENWTLIK